MKPPVIIVVQRTFSVPAERVFDAWLDPGTAGRWLFATPQGEMLRVEMDARVGGSFLVVERRGDAEAEHWGTYREIDRPRRLVFTFAAAQDEEPTLVTIEITPTPDGCALTLTHEMDPQWAEYEDRTRTGWTSILTGLTSTLAEQDGEIVITRFFDAPRELVWRAWTDPARLASWHAPNGCTIEFPELDLREGGRFRSCIRTPDGVNCWCSGVYRELLAPERLIYSIRLTDEQGYPLGAEGAGKDPDWPAETVVTVTLAEEAGGTRLTLHQTAPLSVAKRTGAYGSWLQMLDNLGRVVEEG